MITNDTVQIDIRTKGASDFIATLTSYIPDGDDRAKPAVVIFAGGGYKVVAQYEAAPTAKKYAERGFAAFTVHYSCMPARFPQSLCEGLWAIGYVREHADEFGIDPDNISAMGFSAGGHLVASIGTLWNLPELEEYLGGDLCRYRPNRIVLCYPVITNKGKHHRDSFVNLLGAGADDEKLLALTSLEDQVGSHTPPTFIWHGASDGIVPPDGSIRFVEGLYESGVHVEFHLYPFASHGGGLNRGAYHEDWSDKAEIFMRDERLRDL